MIMPDTYTGSAPSQRRPTPRRHPWFAVAEALADLKRSFQEWDEEDDEQARPHRQDAPAHAGV